MDPNDQKIQISQAYSEQCHRPVLRCGPMEVLAEAQWLWCQITGRALSVYMVVYVRHNILCANIHSLTILITVLLCLSHTLSKKTSASSKNECPEEEGLKHHSLTISRNCLINVVYLVSPSLAACPEESFSFYVSLTFLWSSNIPEVCKVSLLSFTWSIVRLLIKGGQLP